MFLKELSLCSFRNYKNLSFKFSEKINVLYGGNGVGKTNILEAIYMLGNGYSFKTRFDKELIQYNDNNYSIRGIFNDENISYNTIIDIIYQKSSKHILIDKKEIKSRKDIIGRVLYILFLPNDTDLVLGEPKARRDYFNMFISTISSEYLNILIKYTKLLKMRNACLAQKSDEAHIYNKDLATYGLYLIDQNNKHAKMLGEYMNEIFNKIFNVNNLYDIKYSNSAMEIKTETEYIEKLESTLQTQIKMKTTFFGAHRGDYIFSYNNSNSKRFSSQGENRMFTLIMKLASELMLSNIKKCSPILLIDDAMLELDNYKRDSILKYIKTRGQVFITVTEKDKVKDLNDGLSFDIKNIDI